MFARPVWNGSVCRKSRAPARAHLLYLLFIFEMIFNATLLIFLLAVVVLSAFADFSRNDDNRRRVSNASRDNNDARDLAIFIRPPWNYNPATPGKCVDPNAFFDSDVVVTFEGDASSLDGATFSDLEDAFLESYNTLRRTFCDDEYRVVTDVTVDQSSLNENPLINEFSLRFLVNAGCDRCPMDTTLFTPNPNDSTRRMTEANDARGLRIYKRPHNVRGASPPSSPPISTPAPRPVAVAAPPPPPAPSPTFRSEDECCPPNGQRRAMYASEFVNAFDSTYNALTIGNRVLQEADPVQLIILAVEIASIACDEPTEEFDTEVLVELSGSPEDVTDSELLALESSFRSSYNNLGEFLCDPLFRNVLDVTAELLDASVRRHLDKIKENGGSKRALQTRGRFAYRVRAKCRGCRRDPRLFAQGVSGRRELEMKYNRQLQFVFDQDTCYCVVGAEERGITQGEFTIGYDDSIKVLNDEGILVNINGVDGVKEEPIYTWSPTTSPTNFPTAPTDSPVPSPSPSAEPT
jgi:hypothetical protein